MTCMCVCLWSSAGILRGDLFDQKVKFLLGLILGKIRLEYGLMVESMGRLHLGE